MPTERMALWVALPLVAGWWGVGLVVLGAVVLTRLDRESEHTTPPVGE